MQRLAQRILLVFFVALVVRTAGLEHFPPGLWFDEGLNGVDAWKGLHGSGLRIVYPDIFPREPLLVWLLTATFAVTGPSVVAMRVVVALIGAAACAFLTALVFEAGPRRRHLGLALAVGFVLATLHWHAHFSRLVFRTNLVPLIACAAVWAMARAARTESPRRRLIAWFGAGAVAGAGFYAYLAWYFFLPVLAIWFWALRKPDEPAVSASPEDCAPQVTAQPPATARRLDLPIFVTGALLIALPIAMHYVAQPEHLTGRPQAISPLADQESLDGPIRLMLRNIGYVATMFFWPGGGDHVPKHNVPRTPVLGPLWSGFWILFLAGIIGALNDLARRGGRGRRALAWLVWLAAMSLPSIVSRTDSANMLRNLGATPAVAWFIGDGWRRLETLILRRIPAARCSHRIRRLLGAAALVLLLGGALLQVHKAWIAHPSVPGIRDDFNGLHVDLAAVAGNAVDGVPLFVPTDFIANKTFEFLTLGRFDIRPMDKVEAISLPPDGSAADHRILCSVFTRNLDVLTRLFPDGQVEQPEGPTTGPRPGVVYRIPARALVSRDEAQRLADRIPLETDR